MASIAMFGREALAVDMEELLVPEPEESLAGGYNQLDDVRSHEER